MGQRELTEDQEELEQDPHQVYAAPEDMPTGPAMAPSTNQNSSSQARLGAGRPMTDSMAQDVMHLQDDGAQDSAFILP